MAQNYLFIAISFYGNVVCKNVQCVTALKMNKQWEAFYLFIAEFFAK